MLDTAKNLQNRLIAINCNDELKAAIVAFIEKFKNEKGLCGLVYRANLHYIEDNSSKPNLVCEIQKFI